MKKKHRKYYPISRTILVDSKKPIIVEPKNQMMLPRQAVGEGIILLMDAIKWYGDYRNNLAINSEIDAHMASLEIGEKKTVTIEFGGGEAKTIFETSGHPQTMRKISNSQRTIHLKGRYPRSVSEMRSWINAKIGKDIKTGNIKPLPADSGLDRSYQRERFNSREFDFSRGIDRAPKGDFDIGDRDTMWA